MRGKPGNVVLNTTVTNTLNTQTLHLFLLHMYSYYSSFIVAILLDRTLQMLYCILPISSIVSNQQVMQVSLCIRAYCSISCTKEHCKMHSKCITQLCTCMYVVYTRMYLYQCLCIQYAQCIVVYACIPLFHALHACISSVSKKNTVH